MVSDILEEHGFEMLDRLGSGGYGQVFKVNWDKYPGQEFAAKVISLVDCSKEMFTEERLTEIAALERLDNPNIINLFYYIKTQSVFILIFEYCPNGSLHSYIKHHGVLNEIEFKSVACQCIRALRKCHQNNVYHRDIKPANLLIDQYNRIKFADFGLSEISHNCKDCHRFNGSFHFIAPEVLKKTAYDTSKIDIWSLGITFYFLLTGSVPFNGVDRETQLHSIYSSSVVFPSHVSPVIQSLVWRMLRLDPETRPSIYDIAKKCSKWEKNLSNPLKSTKNWKLFKLSKRSDSYGGMKKIISQNRPLAFQVALSKSNTRAIISQLHDQSNFHSFYK